MRILFHIPACALRILSVYAENTNAYLCKKLQDNCYNCKLSQREIIISPTRLIMWAYKLTELQAAHTLSDQANFDHILSDMASVNAVMTCLKIAVAGMRPRTWISGKVMWPS